MYNLTEYTPQQLRVMRTAIQDRIDKQREFVKAREAHGPDLINLLIEDISAAKVELETLFEMRVHVITALQIVKDREQVVSN